MFTFWTNSRDKNATITVYNIIDEGEKAPGTKDLRGAGAPFSPPSLNIIPVKPEKEVTIMSVFYPVTRSTRSAIYDPFKAISDFERAFFGDFAGKGDMVVSGSFRTDIRKEDGKYILEADLPGVEKSDISVSVENDTLTIKAERKLKKDEEDKNGYIRRERSFGSYVRSFDISDIDSDAICAKFDNGVLTLTLPVKEEIIPEAKTLTIE